jgi:hypothetical protein
MAGASAPAISHFRAVFQMQSEHFFERSRHQGYDEFLNSTASQFERIP